MPRRQSIPKTQQSAPSQETLQLQLLAKGLSSVIKNIKNKRERKAFLEEFHEELKRCFAREPKLELEPHEIELNKLGDKELGVKLAQKMARPAIPDEVFWLQCLATAIYTSPLKKLLPSEFQRDAEKLREFVRDILLKAAGHAANPKAALSPEYPKILEAFQHHSVDEALHNFFFHGLPRKELRIRPGLQAKLTPALKKDVTLLLKFLFQKKSKGTLGLVLNWLKITADGSQFRKNLNCAGTWPDQQQLHQDGMKASEISPHVARLSGASITTQREIEAADRARQRKKLLYK